jgi:hypothetical protein
VIAVDGKTLRGSGHGQENSRHLLAACDHAHGAVPGQVEVGAETSEVPMFPALLTAWTSPMGSSPPMLYTPSVSTPRSWPGAAPTTC